MFKSVIPDFCTLFVLPVSIVDPLPVTYLWFICRITTHLFHSITEPTDRNIRIILNKSMPCKNKKTRHMLKLTIPGFSSSSKNLSVLVEVFINISRRRRKRSTREKYE